MINPDPQKYLALRDGFNVLGRERFPKTWTDSELDARDLPKLDDLRRHTDEEATQRREKQAIDIARHCDAERAAAAEKKAHAKKAARAGSSVTGSPYGAEPVGPVGSSREKFKKARPLHGKTAPPDQAQRQQDVSVAMRAQTTVEIVMLARDETAYQNEYDARQRRKQTEPEFRKLLYSGQRRSVLLNARDGKVVDIPNTHWLADMFRVSFAQGTGSWTDNEGRKYRGLVWIEKGDGLPIVDKTLPLQPQDRRADANNAPLPPTSNRGRKKGQGEIDDTASLAKMEKLINDPRSPVTLNHAARQVASSALGASDDSTVRRLSRKYRKQHGP